jgi:transposase-like protein
MSVQTVDMSKRDVGEWQRRRELIAEQARSGQSLALFCREHGIAVWQIHAWRKRLRVLDTVTDGTSKPVAGSNGFVEVQVMSTEPPLSEATSGKAIEIRLCRGRSVLVEPGFDVLHLQRLVAALETA